MNHGRDTNRGKGNTQHRNAKQDDDSMKMATTENVSQKTTRVLTSWNKQNGFMEGNIQEDTISKSC